MRTISWLKTIKTDYEESKNLGEGFTEWFLKRKLGFWGKLILAYLLWLFYSYLLFDLGRLWLFFEVSVVIATILLIGEFIYTCLKNSKNHIKKDR